MNQTLWAAYLATFIMVLAGCVGEPIRSSEKTTYRIGVYDSRAIAVAFAGSEHFNQWMSGLHAEYKKAKAAGDQIRVEELEAEGAARQRQLHTQAFSTAPVDDILEQIEDRLPSIKQKAYVSLLVSKWDTEKMAKHPSADRVDLTMGLIDALNPNERQRKQGLDNIKRNLLYNYNLRFTGTKKTKKGRGGWCVRQC